MKTKQPVVRDPDQGLYRKYEVQRLHDPTGKHAHCEYFVLDLQHDKFAVPALAAYAQECQHEFPQLAADLREYVRRTVQAALDRHNHGSSTPPEHGSTT